ncbi:hypothetical protein PROFUN_15851 [Planoprotostelium fungivorum]|uniref:Uncharacterized protein n=1 Tax=Planoprotostelium fungivorum TaxID=1890364 RepID=A0A2P6MU31_9EUKA|nr:hypothetical protein PROFUN_15851 [Planoprotostelium fungivorum]
MVLGLIQMQTDCKLKFESNEFMYSVFSSIHLGFNLQYKQQKHTVVTGPLIKWQMDLAD